MKINKDLMDAIMMLSFIGLVLVATSDFENMTTRNTSIGILCVTAVLSIALRFFGSKKKEEPEISEE
ncbi:hypothetical protein M2137_000643 [Parabacteroides sp. PFB2-10]|uniref:hypothetical protein n=1 Tax=Parabacteroides sp. PFB2-10 TaxID=1742405 RepID=UPI0024766E45|nr:hypothetical protein [Parabacteroides sp. PFB2-10]MDH6311884.1 hypothetical protein [Parabacteroides sp. PFB2-10]MDL2244006.1 hypothetical protein [Parabacteroides sp. OttesenSCG-928-J18]